MVVAAENVWGSIAMQLGGDRVAEVSIIANPATDPHDYEPSAADARLFASARLVIINGLGYDAWAPRLIAANPTRGRLVLNVGDALGLHPGANPHRWYSPVDVRGVIDRVTAAYQQLDPAASSYFAAQHEQYVTQGLAGYSRAVASIRQRFAGQRIGASESIAAPLAAGLGLRLITPAGFLNAISEGADPTAADKAEADAQIAQHDIRVFLFNTQNATPDVQAQVNAAHAQGIPVVALTETLSPATATFQTWQTAQLLALQAALASATTGRNVAMAPVLVRPAAE
ncbi:MAG TPA: zinc ABC transporter substrate-binding protein [Chloroflexota bacterium]|nr:zinc ABC transporter substrate-binding protein [Chloroflexota bacterium]